MGNCLVSNKIPIKNLQPSKEETLKINEKQTIKQFQQICEQKIILSQQLFKIEGEDVKSLIHRSIGALTCLNKNKQLVVGSGAIISKNLVLTSAHNIYDKLLQSQNSCLKFYLGVDGIAKDYYEVESFKYLQEFRTCSGLNKLGLDFALLKLKQQIEYDQFLLLSLPCPTCLISNNSQICLQIFGFPGQYEQNYRPLDKYKRQFLLNQYGLALQERIILIQPTIHKICYGISTLPGQSGCPVVVNHQIIGIHNGGGKPNQEFNVARFVDLSLIIILQKWCEQLKGNPFKIYSENLCPHVQEIVREHLKINTKYNNQQKEIRIDKLQQISNQIQRPNQQLPNQIQQQPILQQQIYPNYEENGPTDEELTYLDLDQASLQQTDVSPYINLTQLHLSYNQLSSIDLTKNIPLIKFFIAYNHLTQINISNNINLTHLYLGSNYISKIDLSKNTNLIHLALQNNKITSIDISKNLSLTHIQLNYNKISQIEVKNHIDLKHFHMRSNQLIFVNLQNNVYLDNLDLSQNLITAIDLSKNINLSQLQISNNNQLSTIDLKSNTKLSIFQMRYSKVQVIDLSSNINLTNIDLLGNRFTSIDLTKNINLAYANICSNLLSKFKYPNFQHQLSSICKVQIFCEQKYFQQINQLKEQWRKKYEDKTLKQYYDQGFSALNINYSSQIK